MGITGHAMGSINGAVPSINEGHHTEEFEGFVPLNFRVIRDQIWST